MVVGKCVGVTDGDTASVYLDNGKSLKIRFHGIDAPEQRQDYGQRAKQKLSDLIYNKYVRVDILDVDKYGRSVGKVFVNGIYVNLEMVKCGFAWHYKYYASKDEDLALAEKEAENNRLGLWAMANPIAPWNWRKIGSKTKNHVNSIPNKISNCPSEGGKSYKIGNKNSGVSKDAVDIKATADGEYWVSSSGKVHNKHCKFFGSSDKGKFTDTPQGVNCKICGGAGDKTKSGKTEVTGEKYWVTSSGKTHNKSCRYYGNTKRGYYTKNPTGNNCKKCGGAGW